MENSKIEEFKLGKVDIGKNHLSIRFLLGDNLVEGAVISDEGNYVVVVEEEINSEGDRKLNYKKLPRRISEAKEVMVEYYDDHSSLIKGLGKVGTIVGVVAVGSLFVRRLKNRET